MKVFASVLFALGILAGATLAGPDMTQPFEFTSISTNVTVAAGDTVTNGTLISGWLDAVFCDWTDSGGGSSSTGTVILATVGGTGSGPSKTLLTLSAVPATDAVYYPRVSACGTTGSTLTTAVGERMALIQDKLYVTAYSKTQTNITALTVRVVFSPTP